MFTQENVDDRSKTGLRIVDLEGDKTAGDIRDTSEITATNVTQDNTQIWGATQIKQYFMKIENNSKKSLLVERREEKYDKLALGYWKGETCLEYETVIVFKF